MKTLQERETAAFLAMVEAMKALELQLAIAQQRIRELEANIK
jgi:hypothetical protein